MRIKLKTILIIAFAVFIAIIILRVTDGFKWILRAFEVAGIYIVLLTLLLLIGFLVFMVFFNKRVDTESDIEAKAWDFVQQWWSDKMNMQEPLKLQDGFMKRGYYDSGQGITEMFIGFNVTKKGSNQRIIFVVGTKPMSIAHFDNSPESDEDTDPFLSWYTLPPAPVPHFDDSAIKAKYSGMRGAMYSPRRFHKKKKDEEESDDDDRSMIGDT